MSLKTDYRFNRPIKKPFFIFLSVATGLMVLVTIAELANKYFHFYKH